MIHRRVVVLLLIVVLAIPTLPGTAQTPTASRTLNPDLLPGIRATVLPQYGCADQLPGSCDNRVEHATPAAADQVDHAHLQSITVTVYEFDTVANAAAAFAQRTAEAEELITEAVQGGSYETVYQTLVNIGTQARLAHMDHARAGRRMWFDVVTVQRDQFVMVVTAFASATILTPGSELADPSLPALPLATVIAADRGPSPILPTFVASGTSTGGLWGFMPDADDPLLMSLVPHVDTVNYSIPAM